MTGSGPMDGPHVQDYVTLLTKPQHLVAAKLPKGFSTVYKEALAAQDTTLEGILLSLGGFSSLLAYFLTKRGVNGTSHYGGQAADQQSLEALQRSTLEVQRQVAMEVSPKSASILGQTKINEFLEKLNSLGEPRHVPQKRPRKYAKTHLTTLFDTARHKQHW